MSAPPDVLRSRRSLWLPTALFAVAAATLATSYALPTVTFRSISARAPEVYSIWGGIVSLWRDGNTILASIVFVFSIVFPIAKLAVIAGVLWRHRASGSSTASSAARVIDALRWLGKWSMLDVLVVAAFVGSIRIGIATASSRPGIVVFAAAIVLSMAAAAALDRALRRGSIVERSAAPRGWMTAAGRVLSAATVVCFAVALFQPLFTVSKGFLFRNEVALWGTGRAMVGSGEPFLGLFLLVTVIALPMARALASALAWWRPDKRHRSRRAAILLDEWAMLDVFALGLAVVHVKLQELAKVQLTAGFWVLYVAAALSFVDAALARRDGAAGREFPIQ